MARQTIKQRYDKEYKRIMGIVEGVRSGRINPHPYSKKLYPKGTQYQVGYKDLEKLIGKRTKRPTKKRLETLESIGVKDIAKIATAFGYNRQQRQYYAERDRIREWIKAQEELGLNVKLPKWLESDLNKDLTITGKSQRVTKQLLTRLKSMTPDKLHKYLTVASQFKDREIRWETEKDRINKIIAELEKEAGGDKYVDFYPDKPADITENDIEALKSITEDKLKGMMQDSPFRQTPEQVAEQQPEEYGADEQYLDLAVEETENGVVWIDKETGEVIQLPEGYTDYARALDEDELTELIIPKFDPQTGQFYDANQPNLVFDMDAKMWVDTSTGEVIERDSLPNAKDIGMNMIDDYLKSFGNEQVEDNFNSIINKLNVKLGEDRAKEIFWEIIEADELPSFYDMYSATSAAGYISFIVSKLGYAGLLSQTDLVAMNEIIDELNTSEYETQ